MLENMPRLDCVLRRAFEALGGLVFRVPAYRYTLIGRTPHGLRAAAPEPWPGVAAAGEAIVAGHFSMGGETVAGDLAIWEGRGGPAWQEAFHSFEWLSDLRALGGEAAHQRARKLVKDWIARNEGWSRIAWRGDVTGRRIAAWITHREFFAEGTEPAFREQLLSSLAKQARHLARVAPGALEGAALVSALKGLALAGIALPPPRPLARALALLCAELPRQILADGGHIERSPSAHMAVLRDLIDVRGALLAAQQPVPGALQIAIDRMAPMLRFYRMSDGGLAVFNGGGEEEAWLADLVLARADAKGKPLAAAPHSGFQRLGSGRSALVMDAGVPARLRCGGGASHAGTLSFEFSAGKDRVVVNCGASARRSAAWAKAARATAAHSTLVVSDTNSTEVLERGLGRGVRRVTATRADAADGAGIEANHDGYVVPFGLIHRRRLQLSASGEELRGEDALIAAPVRRRKAMARRFAVRFHLHPDAKASLLPENNGVLVKLGSGAGMRFVASGGEIALEDSVYLGSGELRRAQQIVVTGSSVAASQGEAAVVAWSFTKV